MFGNASIPDMIISLTLYAANGGRRKPQATTFRPPLRKVYAAKDDFALHFPRFSSRPYGKQNVYTDTCSLCHERIAEDEVEDYAKVAGLIGHGSSGEGDGYDRVDLGLSGGRLAFSP